MCEATDNTSLLKQQKKWIGASWPATTCPCTARGCRAHHFTVRPGKHRSGDWSKMHAIRYVLEATVHRVNLRRAQNQKKNTIVAYFSFLPTFTVSSFCKDTVAYSQHDDDIIPTSTSSVTISVEAKASSVIMSSPQKGKVHEAMKSSKTAGDANHDTLSSRMADLEADFKCEMKKLNAEQRALCQTNTMAFTELRARMIDQEIAHKEEMEAKINQELRLRDLISSTDIVASRVTDLERSTLARFQTLRVDLSATFRVLDDHLCKLEAEIAEQRAEQSDLRRILECLPKQREEVELSSEGENSGVTVQMMAGLGLDEGKKQCEVSSSEL